MKRFHSRFALLLILIILLATWLGAASAAQIQSGSKSADPAEPKASDALTTAWEQVRNSGSYAFTARITQRAVPLARITNVGRTTQTALTK